jgi:site-specific recombinase XerC
MTPFLKKSSQCWFVTVTTKERTYPRLSSGTRDYDTAVAMQDMLTALSRRGSRQWWIIDAIVEKRTTIARVYDFYPERLEELRAELSDADLAPAIDAWDEGLDDRIASGDLAESTAAHYRRQVAWLFPKDEEGRRLPVLRSRLLPAPDAKGVTGRAWLAAKLAEVGGSGSSRRRYAAAWASCFTALVEAGHLERSPLADVALPKNNKSKRPYIERLDDVIRFVNTVTPGAQRAAAAFREGAGVELQAMLNTRRRDIVDVAHRVIWAHGEKNEHRDRQVIVDEWAFAIIMEYVKSAGLHQDALLFPGVTERNHRAEVYRVRDALRAQGVNIPADYKPHNCRNTFAVRGLKAGRDPVLLANNLGHADTSELLRLYGKHRPAITDLVRADQRTKETGK